MELFIAVMVLVSVISVGGGEPGKEAVPTSAVSLPLSALAVGEDKAGVSCRDQKTNLRDLTVSYLSRSIRPSSAATGLR